MKRFLCYAGVVSLAGAALSMAGPLASAASTSPATVYVSPAGVGGAADWSCGAVNLHSKRGAVVNAKGQPYGIGVGSPNDGIITVGFAK